MIIWNSDLAIRFNKFKQAVYIRAKYHQAEDQDRKAKNRLKNYRPNLMIKCRNLKHKNKSRRNRKISVKMKKAMISKTKMENQPFATRLKIKIRKQTLELEIQLNNQI